MSTSVSPQKGVVTVRAFGLWGHSITYGWTFATWHHGTCFSSHRSTSAPSLPLSVYSCFPETILPRPQGSIRDSRARLCRTYVMHTLSHSSTHERMAVYLNHNPRSTTLLLCLPLLTALLTSRSYKSKFSKILILALLFFTTYCLKNIYVNFSSFLTYLSQFHVSDDMCWMFKKNVATHPIPVDFVQRIMPYTLYMLCRIILYEASAFTDLYRLVHP